MEAPNKKKAQITPTNKDTYPFEVTILLPCRNEERNIAFVLNEASAFLKKEGIVGELLVVDNGSTDSSVRIAQSLGARVIHEPTPGYGAALRAGIASSNSQYIIMGDCDGTYDFAHLMPFITKLRQGNHLVMGNRIKGGIEPGAMPFSHRYIGVPILSFLGRLRYHTAVGDFHCGLRGFHADTAKSLPLHCDGMEFATELIAAFAKANKKITEVPTPLRKSPTPRVSHLRTIPDGWRHLKFILWG